jgi:hypothetical protein
MTNSSSECLGQLIGDTFFTISNDDKLYANGILIDMEAKVIERCMKSTFYEFTYISF